MEEIEQKLNHMKIKNDKNERKEDVESEKEKTEKVSNRTMKMQKNKNKRDEKKKNKQSEKNKKEKISNTVNNTNDANVIEKESCNSKEQKEKDQTSDKDVNITLEDGNANTNENEMNKVIAPIVVEYCKNCSMPYEYCEYGKSYEECREENKDKYNYDITKVVVDTDTKKKAKKQEKTTNTKITIQKTSRAKKKVVTVVTGLHAYVKLEKMSKLFSKTFACGSSVIKGTNNFPDHIDIQGDVGNSVIELIMKNCPEITEDKFVILAPK